MPGMEGLEVLQEMKARDASARIVIITAFGTIDLAVDVMKAGATDFLRKPFTMETLRGAVLGALMTQPMQPALGETPEAAAPLEPIPLLFGISTINGYHVQSDPKAVVVEDGNMRYEFSVRDPGGRVETCAVFLPAGVVSEVKALAHRESMPGGAAFWHALCKHVLSNYLYQNADYPPKFFIRVDQIDPGLRNWLKAVLR